MAETPCIATATSIDQAHQILSTLPPSDAAFAYGSAIVPQRNADARRRMIDLIVVVNDAKKWHADNIERNPAHYSTPMTYLGASAIAQLQRSTFGARVYYNTIIPTSPIPGFKYGVVELHHLREDLLTWYSLYLSGRLHKPVQYLTHSTAPPSLADAIEVNLEAAAAAALLTLPERFDERQFYTAIARLSYLGDVRMHLPFETHSKVADLVSPNLDRFRALYAPTDTLAVHTRAQANGTWTRDMHPCAQARLLHTLPPRIRQQVSDSTGIALNGDYAHAWKKRVDAAVVSKAVLATVAATVARSSLTQSIKGLATAGLANSARYLVAKLRKTIRSRFLITRRQYSPR